MMVSRRVGAFILTLAALASSVGCSNDKKADPSASSAAAEAVSGKIEIIGKFSGTEKENFQRVIDGFKKANPNIEVIYTSAGDDVPAMVNTKIAGGSPPSIAMLPQPGVAAEFAGKGQLKPLTGEAEAAVRKNFSKSWQDLGSYGGKLYGTYPKVTYKSPCWYAADKFTAAGVKDPKTWEDFTAAVKTLSESGTTPLAVAGGSGWPLTDLFENVFIRVAGPEAYDKLSKHQIPWTDPKVVESLTLIGDLVKNGKYIDGGNGATAAKIDFPQSIANVFGDKAKAAMICEGDFVGAELKKVGGRYKAGETAKYFQFPSIKGSKPSAIVAGDQAVALIDDKATMRFMAYLASTDAAEQITKAGGVLSANKSFDQSKYPDNVMREMAQLMNTAEVIKFDMSDLAPSTFGGGTASSEWVTLQDFLTNPGDPAATAQKLEDFAKKVTWSS